MAQRHVTGLLHPLHYEQTVVIVIVWYVVGQLKALRNVGEAFLDLHLALPLDPENGTDLALRDSVLGVLHSNMCFAHASHAVQGNRAERLSRMPTEVVLDSINNVVSVEEPRGSR